MANGNIVPSMRAPHMGIDSDNGKPVADQSGKSVRQLDDLSGLPDSFGLSAGAASNDDDFGEDAWGISAFAYLATGDNLGKDVGLRVSESVSKSSGVSLSGVEADFFSSDLSGIGRGSRLRSKPLRFKSLLVFKSTLPLSHESLVCWYLPVWWYDWKGGDSSVCCSYFGGRVSLWVSNPLIQG